MLIGELIEDLILSNIKIWHTATQLKDSSGKLRKDTGMTAQEKVKIHTKTRVENARRSRLRFEIDKFFGEAVQDTKLNYLEEE
jgi:hypothetical protein